MKNILCIIIFYFGNTIVSLDREKAKELNNQANILFADACFDKKIAKKTLKLYDQSINNDTTFEQPYLNKAKLLCQWGKWKEALKLYDKLVIVRPDLTGIFSLGGFILEQKGHRKKAMIRYNNDVTKCDSIISIQPDSLSINIQITRASILMFTKGKDYGIKEYEKIRLKYPDNKFVKSQAVTFYYFDKSVFLKNICK